MIRYQRSGLYYFEKLPSLQFQSEEYWMKAMKPLVTISNNHPIKKKNGIRFSSVAYECML